MSSSEILEAPSLEELLCRRGIHKDELFADYQDYIEQRQREGVRPRLLSILGIPIQDMHIALGRTISVCRFWTWRDKLWV